MLSRLKTLWFFVCLLCQPMIASNMYAGNETDILLPPQQYSGQIAAENDNSSSYYGDDLMPDMWSKPRGGFAGTIGEMLITLPLFNQMDREASEQKMFYIINWPLKSEKKKPDVSGQGSENKKSSGQSATSGTITDNPDSYTGSGDGERPTEQKPPHHTHGACCHASGCNGGRCRCKECLEKLDTVVRVKGPSRQTTDNQASKKQRIESASSHEKNNIIYLLIERQLTDRFIQREMTAFFHRKLEERVPVRPISIQMAKSFGTENIFIHHEGDIISFLPLRGEALYGISCHGLEVAAIPSRYLQQQSRSDEGFYSQLPLVRWTFWGTSRIFFLLSDGRIIIIQHKGYVALRKNLDNQWLLDILEDSPLFLWTFQHQHYIPAQVFDLVSSWTRQYISENFKRSVHSIHTVISHEQQIIVFTNSHNTLHRWHMSEGGWVSKDICIHPGETSSPSGHIKEILLLEDDSALAIMSGHSSDHLQLWTENDQQLFEIAADEKDFKALDDGRIIVWHNSNLMIWEYLSGRWIGKVLLPASEFESDDDKATFFNFTLLRDKRLVVVESHKIIRVCIELNGEWHSMTLYETTCQIGAVVEITDGRIAVGCSDKKILIWDLYQSTLTNP